MFSSLLISIGICTTIICLSYFQNRSETDSCNLHQRRISSRDIFSLIDNKSKQEQKKRIKNLSHFRFGNFFFTQKEFFHLYLILTLAVSISSYFLFAKAITNGFYAFILTLIISISLSYRLLNFFNKQFRREFSCEIQSITFSIQTQLAKGATLDQACKEVLGNNNQGILAADIKFFLDHHASNISEKLPEFYIGLSHRYRRAYLALPAQILSLELNYSQNQATAFEAAYDYFSACDKNREKLKNTTGVIFLTMDCMLLIYLIIIFGILPSLNLGPDSWWQSSERTVEMFYCSALFWSAYLISTVLISKKEEELL
ncbi:MAG: hypothetical protein ACKO3R_00870 [bacterium]